MVTDRDLGTGSCQRQVQALQLPGSVSLTAGTGSAALSCALLPEGGSDKKRAVVGLKRDSGGRAPSTVWHLKYITKPQRQFSFGILTSLQPGYAEFFLNGAYNDGTSCNLWCLRFDKIWK